MNNEEAMYQPLHRLNYKAIIDLDICTEDLCNYFESFEVTEEIKNNHLSFILEFKSNLKKGNEKRTFIT